KGSGSVPILAARPFRATRRREGSRGNIFRRARTDTLRPKKLRARQIPRPREFPRARLARPSHPPLQGSSLESYNSPTSSRAGSEVVSRLFHEDSKTQRLVILIFLEEGAKGKSMAIFGPRGVLTSALIWPW